MRLTRKLGVLLTVPLVATIAFAALAVSVAVAEGVQAQRLQSLVSLAGRAGDLARVVQTERATAVALVVSPGGSKSERVDAYLRASKAADESVARYRQELSTSAGIPSGAGELLDRLDAQLEQLPAIREAVGRGSVAASTIAFQYRILIASTISFREAVAQAGEAPAAVADGIRVSVDLSHAAEALGLQQVAVLRTLDAGRLRPAAAQEIAGSRSAFTDATVAFVTLAPPLWRSWWEAESIGAEVALAQRMQEAVERALPGQPLAVDPSAWVAATTARMDAVHRVERQADQDTESTVDGLRRGAFARAGLESGAVLTAVAIALTLAVRTGRPMVRDLRRLAESARDVAYQRLPALVGHLNDPRTAHDLSPADVADAAPSVGLARRDEIGDVAGAFDEVYRAAVLAAVEQAGTRLGVARMYVTLARRMQRRVSQITAQLDAAERGEQDTARLAWLFGLDHLVTLTQRTTDSLLVLGGQGPGTVRAGTVLLHEVLRAAAGRIEAYRQVDVRAVDEVGVAGPVVDELVLLLAELMDNATRFSAPADRVTVDARLLTDRVVVQIADRGIGIEPVRRHGLSRRLGSVPVVDVTSASAMGLSVVAQIAHRYGLVVELQANVGAGTIAEVVLPATVLRSIQLPGRLPGSHRADNASATPVSGWPSGTAGLAGALQPLAPAQLAVASAPVGTTAELPIYAAAQAAWPSGATDGEPENLVATTLNGLPRRSQTQRPPADARVRAAVSTIRRDPHQVAAAMAAYARGVSRSQTRPVRPVSTSAITGSDR